MSFVSEKSLRILRETSGVEGDGSGTVGGYTKLGGYAQVYTDGRQLYVVDTVTQALKPVSREQARFYKDPPAGSSGRFARD